VLAVTTWLVLRRPWQRPVRAEAQDEEQPTSTAL